MHKEPSFFDWVSSALIHGYTGLQSNPIKEHM
jgi:hypothetical protein